MVVSWREMHCSGIARHATTIQVACSQCLRGRVVLEAYSVGKALYDAGVVQLLPGMPAALSFSRSPCALQISALDMTCEAVVTKMAYLGRQGVRDGRVWVRMRIVRRLTIQHENYPANLAAHKGVQVQKPRNQPQHHDAGLELAVQAEAAWRAVKSGERGGGGGGESGRAFTFGRG
jgi:hypothetical protein